MRSPTRSLAVALALTLCCGLGAAAADEATAELRAGLEERFVLLPLSDGLLLQPKEAGEGPRAIEIRDSLIALEGQPVGRDELRLRLGEEAAELVLAASELDETALRGLLDAEPTSLAEGVADGVAGAAAATSSAAAEVAEEIGGATEEMAEDIEAAARAAERRLAARVKKAEKAIERARRNSQNKYRRTGDSEFAFGSSVTVDRDEVVEDVLVMGGVLKVRGRVEGDATVMAGSATIEGEVTGDVTAIGGPVRLESGAHVHGDVTSVGGRVFRDDDARVGGSVEQVPLSANFDFGPWGDWRRWDRSHDFNMSPWHWWSGMGWSLAKLLFFAGLAWLGLLLASGPIDRMERRIEAEPWKTGLVGLLTQVLFFPVLIMVTVFLAISIIGIPLLLVLPFALLALLIVAGLGFVAVAGRVGGWAEERFGWQLGSPYWVVLLGLGLIGGLSIIGGVLDFGIAPMRFIAGMFMFFGAIVSWAACTIGFGAAVLTRFGTAESWNRAEDVAAPLPPVPRFAEAYKPEEEPPAPDSAAEDTAGEGTADEGTADEGTADEGTAPPEDDRE